MPATRTNGLCVFCLHRLLVTAAATLTWACLGHRRERNEGQHRTVLRQRRCGRSAAILTVNLSSRPQP